MRRLACSVVLVACAGCDADDTTQGSRGVDAGATSDSGTDGRIPQVSCGDMSGLQEGSPWPMRMGCPTHQSRTTVVGPTAPEVVWQTQQLGSRITGASIDASGTLYNVFENRLYAWDPTDGQPVWEYADSTKMLFGQAALGNDGNIYLTPRDNEGLHAVNRETGEAAWVLPLPGDSWSGPAIGSDGTVYAARISLYAIDPESRSVIWEADMPDVNESSPAIGLDGTLYVGSTAGVVRALNPADGSELWSFQADDAVWSTVALANGNVYFGSNDGNVYAVDQTTGELVWRFEVGAQVRSSPAISLEGHVHIGARNGSVYKLDGFDGDVLWEAALDAAEVRSTPLIDGNGDLYLGASNQTVYSLDGATGSVRWSLDLGNDTVESSPALAADGTLYVASDRTYAIR